MSRPFRLPEGGHIDRSQSLTFTFNGQQYAGFNGDTLASALLANGIRVVSRGSKFHRPRGILSAGIEEPNALLGVDVGNGLLPISRATLVPLMDGLRAETQNCFPSVDFDLTRVLDYMRPLWPAGFYNKIFKWPNWHVFEGMVRRIAGLGVLPDGKDTNRYRYLNTHCDVLITGAGPAGLKAALEAGRRGDDVLLVEQDAVLGGSLLYDSKVLDGQIPGDWLRLVLDQLRVMENVRILLLSTVAGYYDHNMLTIHDRSAAWHGTQSVETFWKVRAGHVVLATGAIEQPLLFGNNDLPGIMLASAVHQYAGRYGVGCGEQVVGVVNNNAAWRSILGAYDAGVNVSAIIDGRSHVEDVLEAAASERGIVVHIDAYPQRAQGSKTVKALWFSSTEGRDGKLECDAIAMSGGFNPAVHLYSQAGGKLRYDDMLACFIPHECRQAVTVVGAANGQFIETGSYDITPGKAADTNTNAQWVDFQHDVTVSDIELAVRENYVSVEHMKRYTTAGMSVDQGKTSNLNALKILAELTNRSQDGIGTTTFRPPFMPITLGTIGGNRRGNFYAPPRLLAAHDWHASHSAVFDNYGEWKRPAYYGDNREQAIAREARQVRETAGIFDGSSLGKIEVKGPDAADFLNRIYVNTVPTLMLGKARYGLMLTENGIIMDDGIFVRLADDHFLVNTTSGNANRVAAWFEEWHQCEWPHLDVVFSPITSQWAVAMLAGPNSRTILQKLEGMIDLSTALFPHMSFSKGSFSNGTPYRIQRVSYSGELSYEISVPTMRATSLFEQLWKSGQTQGLHLFGLEALMVLRMEKGFLHVGVDTDGTSNPFDVGFERIIANKTIDFIGARSLQRMHDQSSKRRQLIGFELIKGGTVLAGAHFVSGRGTTQRSEGFVTSAYASPILKKTIGLGLLERGFERKSEIVHIYDDKQIIAARIIDPCFFDPQGERMRV